MATTNSSSGAVRALERAETPYVLFPDDLSIQFQLEPSQARTAIRLGLFGPWFMVQGRPAVLRDTLREHLRLRMAQRSELDKELIPENRLRDGAPVEPPLEPCT